ncbi:hypothetical protein EMCRGX_G025737 [Ephydatia muelleri]
MFSMGSSQPAMLHNLQPSTQYSFVEAACTTAGCQTGGVANVTTLDSVWQIPLHEDWISCGGPYGGAYSHSPIPQLEQDVVAPGHKEHEPLAVSIPSHHWMENYSSLGSKFSQD